METEERLTTSVKVMQSNQFERKWSAVCACFSLQGSAETQLRCTSFVEYSFLFPNVQKII